jgi:spore maturation protein CgeB
VRFVLFYHSLVSDWNHGNAHFLRGVVRELTARGHEVAVYEPADGWSRRNLLAHHGAQALAEFQAAFPRLRSTTYDAKALDLDAALERADVVIVHEWNAPELVARIGRHRAAGASFCGWLPNHRVPEVFARFAVTTHVPRAPYVRMLPGIPTIRVFEALACGIPLVCAPWRDCEGLFRPGDMLFAADGVQAKEHIRAVLADPDLAAALSANGLRTIRERHTCAHRVDQLLGICAELGLPHPLEPTLEAVA